MKPRVEFVASRRRAGARALPARRLAREAIAASVGRMRRRAARDGAELCIHLADDAHVRALNARWRGLDKPTNVLSFPAFAALAARAARACSATSCSPSRRWRARRTTEDKPLADHYRHLVVHGFLHLDRLRPRDATPTPRRMEAMETRILARLGVADPYRAGALAEAEP